MPERIVKVNYTDYIKNIVGNKKSIVTMGFFDGVHIGHQYILQKLIDEAKKTNCQSVVISFDPHPKVVLSKSNIEFKYLNTPSEKTELIKQQGIDKVVILKFTKELAQMQSFEYLKDILANSINIQTLLVGYDHSFGSDKLNDISILNKYGKILDFNVKKIDYFNFNQQGLSSSIIRELITNGDIKKANALLGNNFTFNGSVTTGKQIGKQIDFPTANIIPNKCKSLPKTGVFAVKIHIHNTTQFGMLNIGFNPTISDNNKRTIEVHIFNFNADIYGESIKIECVDKIRDELKFNSIKDLKDQLNRDKIHTTNIFKKLDQPI